LFSDYSREDKPLLGYGIKSGRIALQTAGFGQAFFIIGQRKENSP
jgi:hypothetical protein